MIKQLIDKLIAFASNIGKENTKESSKRSLAIYTTIVLGSYVVVRFTNYKNMEVVLGEILGFALTLLGVTAWEKTKMTKLKKDENS